MAKGTAERREGVVHPAALGPAPMGTLHKLDPKTPRKLRETQWTERGVRLSPAKRLIEQTVESDWFWPAMLTFPLGAFLIILFW